MMMMKMMMMKMMQDTGKTEVDNMSEGGCGRKVCNRLQVAKYPG